MGAFAAYLGVQTSVMAEAKAILLGLRFAKNLNYSQGLVESDSLLLVQILNSLVQVPLLYILLEKSGK